MLKNCVGKKSFKAIFAGLHLFFPLYFRKKRRQSEGVKESEEERRRTGQLQ